MATRVMLKHKDNGLLKAGFIGFSWTTLFFGLFPALFRSDFKTFFLGFLLYAILALTTFGIGPFLASLIWAFMYNKWYTRRLLERGYEFADSNSVVAQAKFQLQVA